LAQVYGIDAAPNDYMVHLLRIWDVVEAKYDVDLAIETRQVLEAYADGLNHYAVLHPDEVLLPDIYPLDGKDIVAGSVHKSPLFFGLDDTLGELFEDTRQHEVSKKLSGLPIWGPRANLSGLAYLQVDGSPGFGSNTLSVGPGRSADGSTFLTVNSHQPWEGAVTWYEAHLHSEGGWDAVGGLFPGSPVVIHGHNRYLGWAFTVNYPDLADVYVLDINPEDEYQYRFDGEWLDLEVRSAAISVRLLGGLKITVNQEVLWSVYGPVVRQDHGTYALRYAGSGLVNIWEQLYRMNKAENFTEWKSAMEQGGLPNFNVGYADHEGNIYYLYNAMLPVRAEGYEWREYLPGDTSDTLWDHYMAFDDLPQVTNPSAGFIQNANSTPFHTTLDPDNPRPEDYSATFGIDTHMTNRAVRALELLSGDPDITFDEFGAIKYDWTYAEVSEMARFVRVIREASLPEVGPELLEAQRVIGEWDLQMSPASGGATLGALTVHFLADAGYSVGILAHPIDEPIGNQAIIAAFVQAANYLLEKHGGVDIPWLQVNRLQRGELNLGLGGGRDVLHAIYGRLGEDGRFRGRQGDSYVMLVRWDAQGGVESYSIHQYGSATLDADSPHYADQAYLFVRRELKPVWLDEADIREHLEREYVPGQEDSPNP
jgi:penicillin amidase/acyl-homoserine-lactone acylase